jgi:hypothetical protein
MIKDAAQTEHANPGAAGVSVLRGRVLLAVGGQSWQAGTAPCSASRRTARPSGAPGLGRAADRCQSPVTTYGRQPSGEVVRLSHDLAAGWHRVLPGWLVT